MSDEPNAVPASPVSPTVPTDPVAPGAVPTAQAVLGTPTPPTVPVAGGRRRESIAGVTQTEQPQAAETPVQTTQEAPPEVAPTAPEAERSAELGPELEKFVEQTEKQSDKQPPETVVAAETMPTAVPKTVKQPVVILPLTQKDLQAGQKKGTTNSIRWLAEWCVRQIKKFSSILVVYRENE
jgi:hypothetical protein